MKIYLANRAYFFTNFPKLKIIELLALYHIAYISYSLYAYIHIHIGYMRINR